MNVLNVFGLIYAHGLAGNGSAVGPTLEKREKWKKIECLTDELNIIKHNLKI